MKEIYNYEDAPISGIHKKIFISVALGQIACSYALGIAGTAITDAVEPLNLNSFWVGLIGAGTLLGLFGSILVGRLADVIGRRLLFRTDMILFTILSISQFFVSDSVLLLLIRIGIGLAIAIDYTVGSSLLTEWFPKNKSAKYQSTLLIFWIIGFVAAYLVGIFLKGFGDDNWRWVISSSAVPGIITLLWRWGARIPESPSWLANKGNNQAALELIHQHLGKNYTLPKKETSLEDEKAASWKDLFSKETRRNTLVGGIFYGCQVFPFFGIGIFLPLLMEGMNIGNPYISGILYNVFMIIGVILGVLIFNRIPRRTFLVSTFYASAAALVIIVIWPSAPVIITLILFSIFSVILSASLVLENPYPPELFDTRLRASGVGAVIAISRIGAASGTFLLPVITSHFGVHITLVVCCLSLLVGGVVCQIWAPETSPNFTEKLA
ncbi:MFS transporter [Paenibacillus peoriae]|uniref:MFS transporter n=1 Tax=Paenibacillus peoriae TaxID=59893 RepID=UPI00026C56B8|nr:MFS transporter [Paenibacillus peoriae]MEC0184802.1 MFS transporter [Paenibacillus peoriae]